MKSDSSAQFAVPWGPLGYPTYKRTYARRLRESVATSPTEEFHQTVERVIKAARTQLNVGFTNEEEDDLREILMNLKGFVAGRFLWQLGTATVDHLGFMSLQNCAFVVINEPIRPFTWAMDALMLGSGVGYNIQREYVYQLPKVKRAKITRKDTGDADFIVPDSREGWVKLLGRVLKAHFYSGKNFNYSTMLVRGKGAPIRGFGGVASGPEELCWGVEQISKVLNARAGKRIRPIDALDIMNIIGYVVVSGNVRRSAQIAIGDMDDLEYLNAKRWDLGNIPNWRAMSNNSIVCNDFSRLPPQFWEGYTGAGEPYGLINLRLAQREGRHGETQFPDPDVMGFNPCVTGDTNILTSNGYLPIKNAVGTEVKVWNGFEWSAVTPRITGFRQPIHRVTLSNGMELSCTSAHKWVVVNGYGEVQKQERVETRNLLIGSKLLKHSYPVIDEGSDPDWESDAYTQGLYSADGSKGRPEIWLYGGKHQLLSHIDGHQGYADIRRTVVNLHSPATLKEKEDVPNNCSLSYRLGWFAGLCDGDGTLTKDGNLQVSSVDKQFLRDVQYMLTTCGVASKISVMHKAARKEMPDGRGSSKVYDCQESYRLMLSAEAVANLRDLGMKTIRLDLKSVMPDRDASRFVTVESIEYLGIEDVVYCFTEPLRNLGCFNGIVTGQCAEQGLANYETCCLAEIPLPNIASKEELLKVAKYLYRINKHSLTLGCHAPETEEIVRKNMRMGIGITGYLQATDGQRSWLSDVYNALRVYDKEYSDAHGWPASVKLTTVKPSGTLSLLAGVTPGVHPGYSQFFIRRVRMDSQATLVAVCRANGYHIEPQKNFDGTDDRNTVVVEFPCRYPEGTVLAKDLSAIDQLEWVRKLQTEWSDNSVSCTVYYRMEELPAIKQYLTENYNDNFKTVSFLLHSEHGFKQAPYEEITEERYNELAAQVTPIRSVEVAETDVLGSEECAVGVCPIR